MIITYNVTHANCSTVILPKKAAESLIEFFWLIYGDFGTLSTRSLPVDVSVDVSIERYI